jgi:hypothetical protein
MMFVSFNSNTTGDTCGAGTVNPFDGFSGSRVAQSLVLCSVLYSSMFILLSFFFWPFYCLYFFGLRFLTTPLVSPNFYSVCLQFTVSDYPFGIHRLLFHRFPYKQLYVYVSVRFSMETSLKNINMYSISF